MTIYDKLSPLGRHMENVRRSYHRIAFQVEGKKMSEDVWLAEWEALHDAAAVAEHYARSIRE